MKIYSSIAVLTSSALILSGCAATTESLTPVVISPSVSASADASADPEISADPNVPVVDGGLATANATKEQLLYLIEEEKLAHDVYEAMFAIWGARVFGNILQSESSHQSQVLTVMQARNIADPRSSTSGVFVNNELQALYNELIAKGSKSAIDAYEVGVAIEELDIDDLTKMLATAKDADVIAMMENLRRGSENHLRAFNNQL
jgi:hypothetical protein